MLLLIDYGPSDLLIFFVAFHQTQIDHGRKMYNASQCNYKYCEELV